MPRAWHPSPFLRASAALHLAGTAGIALQPGLWPWVAGALVADHALLAAAGLWPRSRLLGPNLRRQPPERAARGEVALTFDDGPDPDATPGVLEILSRAGCRASFFCVGRRAQRHPGLVADMAAAGHGVENHTHRHLKRFSLLGPRGVAREVDGAQAALTALAGRPPSYVRAPAGLRNLCLEPVLARRGLRLASWTRRGFDSLHGDAMAVAGRLLRRAAAGDILVLHDGGGARDGRGRPVVLEALPRVLDGLSRAGLRPVPLPPAD